MNKILFLSLLILPVSVFAQTHSVSYYQTECIQLASEFYHAVSTKDAWKSFERKADDLDNEIDYDQRNGSGFSYEEKTNLKGLQLGLKLMKDFGDGISPDGYAGAFNGKTLKYIRLLFPEMKWEVYKSYEADCSVYKLTFRDYVVFAARHNRKGSLMKISWRDSRQSCKTIGGNFNTLGGFYKTFWDNSECKSFGSTPGIIVTGFEFVQYLEDSYAQVKSFEDE